MGSTQINGHLQSQYCSTGQSGPVSTGKKLTLFLVDCADTRTNQVVHVGWNDGTPGGCSLAADLGPFPKGGTCTNPGPGQNNQYVWRDAAGLHHITVDSTRVADNGCTKFIDGITQAYLDIVTP
jgi:hypothetical protein